MVHISSYESLLSTTISCECGRFEFPLNVNLASCYCTCYMLLRTALQMAVLVDQVVGRSTTLV